MGLGACEGAVGSMGAATKRWSLHPVGQDPSSLSDGICSGGYFKLPLFEDPELLKLLITQHSLLFPDYDTALEQEGEQPSYLH